MGKDMDMDRDMEMGSDRDMDTDSGYVNYETASHRLIEAAVTDI